MSWKGGNWGPKTNEFETRRGRRYKRSRIARHRIQRERVTGFVPCLRNCRLLWTPQSVKITVHGKYRLRLVCSCRNTNTRNYFISLQVDQWTLHLHEYNTKQNLCGIEQNGSGSSFSLSREGRVLAGTQTPGTGGNSPRKKNKCKALLKTWIYIKKHSRMQTKRYQGGNSAVTLWGGVWIKQLTRGQDVYWPEDKMRI